jgi:hypothetical protein
MEKKNRKKLSIECSVCKAQFDIWVNTEHAGSDLEEGIRNHVNNYCPVCKALEELNNKKTK